MKMMNLIYNPAVLGHDTGPEHPENAGRLLGFEGLVPEAELPDGAAFLELVHPKSYIEAVRQSAQTGLSLDGDTPVSAGSFAAATAAVGVDDNHLLIIHVLLFPFF